MEERKKCNKNTKDISFAGHYIIIRSLHLTDIKKLQWFRMVRKKFNAVYRYFLIKTETLPLGTFLQLNFLNSKHNFQRPTRPILFQVSTALV